jgi:hypothetical protein
MNQPDEPQDLLRAMVALTPASPPVVNGPVTDAVGGCPLYAVTCRQRNARSHRHSSDNHSPDYFQVCAASGVPAAIAPVGAGQPRSTQVNPGQR